MSTQTDVKRIYWDEEEATLVYELVNGRKLCLDVETTTFDRIPMEASVVVWIAYKPADGI